MLQYSNIYTMTDLEAKAEQKILDLLNGVYHKLAKHPQVSDEQRELLPTQEELMQNLDPECFYYQSLLRSLAIDSYASAIVNQSSLSQQLCGMLTATMQFLNQMGELLKKNSQKKDILEKYNRTCQCLVETVKISQQMFPKTSYLQDQNKLIESVSVGKKIDESTFSKLRHENQQLRKKSQSSQIQLLNMESKLTKLLKQHEGCQRSQGIGNKISNIELRQELALKQAQIERMNEQFSFEIEKYNTVFQAMKRQLEEMKGYQNIDLIQQIQLLETEIVKLREQRDRDQIIIRQLRHDHTAFTMGYYSPRESSRYHSRYEY